MANSSTPSFACDVMLGALARWLRAAGYDAWWSNSINDWDLVRLARREGRILLSADTGIFRIGIVRDGDVPALQVPNGLSVREQLAFVIGQLGLQPLDPRCMACGGELAEVPKARVRDRVPAASFAWVDQFHECLRCGQVFWQGTHWPAIAERLRHASDPQ
jgi:uncharacterized protein with PIN domain